MPVKLAKKVKKLKIAKPQKQQSVVVAKNISSGPRQPNLTTTKGSTVVTHREIVLESLLNSTSYAVREIVALQPALSSESNGIPMGVWLPNVASEYDNYEFSSLKVHYVPTCSTLATGLVIMSYDPNPNGAAPSTFASARNAIGCVTSAVRDKVTLDLTRHVVKRKLLTRTRRVNELAMYDVGRLFLATTAGDNSASVGYVEVEYSVRLSNPQTAESGSTVVPSAPVLPSQEWVGSGVADGTNIHVGTLLSGSNIKNSTAIMEGLFGTPPVGPTLITVRSPVPRSTIVSSTTINGFTHSFYGAPASNALVYNFSFNKPGMYRVRAFVPGDYEDLAMYGLELLDWGSTPNLASGTPNFSGGRTALGYTAAGTLIAGYSFGGYNRGFRTNATGGTSICDMATELDTTVLSVGPDQLFSIGLGVRNVVAVSENASAMYTYNQASGRLRITITYLGEVDGL